MLRAFRISTLQKCLHTTQQGTACKLGCCRPPLQLLGSIWAPAHRLPTSPWISTSQPAGMQAVAGKGTSHRGICAESVLGDTCSALTAGNAWCQCPGCPFAREEKAEMEQCLRKTLIFNSWDCSDAQVSVGSYRELKSMERGEKRLKLISRNAFL